MITLFGNDDITGRGNNNKNTNKTPEAIVSIHLANSGDDCSNDDGNTKFLAKNAGYFPGVRAYVEICTKRLIRLIM